MTLRAVIVGGSLGGLLTGLMLRQAGVHVDIYERNATSLQSRGAGIRVQPVMERLLKEALDIDIASISTRASSIQYIDRAGTALHTLEETVHYTSWGALYGLLMARFGEKHYHLNAELAGFTQDEEEVLATLTDGTAIVSDLLVFADGVNSTGRQLLAPQVQPEYAGYICWRGYLYEDRISAASRAVLSDAMTIALLNPGHVHVYPIPPGADEGGNQGAGCCFNYIWYRNLPAGDAFNHTMTDRQGVLRSGSVPPGMVRDEVIAELKQYAREHLPAAIAELVGNTEAPFIQTIADIHVPRMVHGRACLIGDAASGGRPHLGAATAKAAINAYTLARALQGAAADVPLALAAWAPAQEQLGSAMLARNRALGDQLQFGTDSRPGQARLRPGIDDLLAGLPGYGQLRLRPV